MNKIKETIRDYEYMTAGRFYNEAQKRAIFNLAARANLLQESDESELKALLFSEEMQEYKTQTDCANGILMASFFKNSEFKNRILLNRKQTIESLSEKRLFDSRESWLKFIHLGNKFCNMFEKAIYLYSLQKVDMAFKILQEIAENYHYLSVKLMVALCRETKSVNREARYLIILNRITEELLYDEAPAEYEDRLQEIWNEIPEEQIEEAYNLKLTYFSEDAEVGAHIGFN